MIARPQIAPEGPQTVAECRRLVQYHEQEVERIERRIEAIGARWEQREQRQEHER